MKKLLFLLTAILCVSPIAAQSPVSISHIATQYGANPSVTFSVSFTSPPTVPMSLDSVWVFVDYQPITNGSLGA
ncbi:MAG: hypothetical protein LBS12_07545, partial [Prevotellaceae bacterium]|nr:hypothetical protein [Prevotellaceae bacterium]